jgi:flagellar basal-body rod protein FlgB
MNPIINVLQFGLDGAYARNQAISNNIANVSTPDYKRKDVNFKSVLNKNLENIQSSGSDYKKIDLARTNAHHRTSKSVSEAYGQLQKYPNSVYRNDGNNVDIDTEMAKLSKNNLYYNTLSQQISGKFSMIKEVIDKGSE